MPQLVQAFVFVKWHLACVTTDPLTVDSESLPSCGPFLRETSSWCLADKTCPPSSQNSSSQ